MYTTKSIFMLGLLALGICAEMDHHMHFQRAAICPMCEPSAASVRNLGRPSVSTESTVLRLEKRGQKQKEKERKRKEEQEAREAQEAAEAEVVHPEHSEPKHDNVRSYVYPSQHL